MDFVRPHKLACVLLLIVNTVLACGTSKVDSPLSQVASNTFSNSLIYGAPWGSDTLHNLDVGGETKQQIAYRFRAVRSGKVESIRVFWTDNRDRPGYAKGSGGTIRIELFADAGTADHVPAGKALAAMLFVPNYANGKDPLGVAGVFRLLPFPAPAQVEEGKLYHLTFTNIDGAPTSNYLGVDEHIVYGGGESQPVVSTLDFGLLSNMNGTGWVDASKDFAQTKPNKLTPIVSLYFSDGSSQGNGYMEVWTLQPRQISGNKAVRERITPTATVMNLASVSVRVKKIRGAGPLTLQVSQLDGTVLAGAVVAAAYVKSDRHDWVIGMFSQDITLQAGQTYFLTLTSDMGAYEAYCIRDGSAFGFSPATVFGDGYAEFNRDDGKGWLGWYGWSDEGSPNQKEGDLQFYFSKRLPARAFAPAVNAPAQ